VHAGERLAVYDDRSGDPRTDRQEQELAAAAPGAEAGLGHTAGSDVVAHRDREAGALGGELAQRGVAPAEVGREDADAVRLVDDAGHGDAEPARCQVAIGGGGGEIGGEVDQRADDVVRTRLATRRATVGVQHHAVDAGDRRFHHGAADVQADYAVHGVAPRPAQRR
jgi:hypothetical protein